MGEWISHILTFLVTAPTRPAGAAYALMWSTILVMMIWERRHPAYPMDHRGTWKRDVTAGVIYSMAIIPAAGLINRYLSFTPVLPRQFFAIPFGIRFVMFMVLGDFGYYWVHRAMHSKWLWNVHRWHHSPTYMYWLMGVRASLLLQVLVNIPYIFAQAVLAISPWWTGLAILFKNGFQSNWMHLNVRRGSWRLAPMSRLPLGAWPSVYDQPAGFTFAAQLAYLRLQFGPPNKGERHGQGHGS